MTQITPPKSQTVLITGATSGIGLALARVFAREGHPVILHGRDAEKLHSVQTALQEAAREPVHTICCDLTDEHASEQIVADLERQSLTVDILVNNAGFGDSGPFGSADNRKLMNMLAVNVTALTALSHALLPSMIKRGQGKILNVASVAAFLPGPYMAVYYATKAYVLSLSEALAEELGGQNIQVSVLCPGPTESQFAITARADGSRMFNGPLVQRAETVAEYGYRTLMVGQVVAISGWWNRLFVLLTRLVPRFVVRSVMGRVGKR